jgi:peptidyl-dipeptidase Dcp
MKNKLVAVVILIMNFGMVNAQNNPLLEDFNTPHQTAPFNQIKNEHFIPAFQESIKQGEAEIDAIVKNQAAPTFDQHSCCSRPCWKVIESYCRRFFQFNEC